MTSVPESSGIIGEIVGERVARWERAVEWPFAIFTVRFLSTTQPRPWFTWALFAVLLDNNNREPVARLHFNGRRKYLGLLDENREGTRHPIELLYEHAGEIREAVTR